MLDGAELPVLVPEVDDLMIERGFRPGVEDRMLVDVSCGKRVREFFSRWRIERMYEAAASIDGIDSDWGGGGFSLILNHRFPGDGRDNLAVQFLDRHLGGQLRREEQARAEKGDGGKLGFHQASVCLK